MIKELLQDENVPAFQNFEAVRNPQLRTLLQIINEKLPNQELFYASDIQKHLGRYLSQRSPNIIDILTNLRKLKILNPTEQNSQNMYLYSRNKVLLVGVFIKSKETEQSLHSIAKRLHSDLGTHPLSQLIKGIEVNSSEKTISQINTEDGNLWKTPLGERIKVIIENPTVSYQSEPFSSSEIAKGLELTDDYKHLVTLLYSNNTGVLRGVEKKVVGKKGFRLAFKAEHYILAGMYFGLIQKGSTASAAKVQLAELIEGTTLEPYFSEDGFTIHTSRNRQLFKTNSLWLNLPFFGNEEQSRNQPIHPNIKPASEIPMTKTEQVMNLLSQINESDLEIARHWTTQKLRRNMRKLSRRETHVSREIFPEEMIKIIEIIYQIDKGNLKDLELEVKMANDFNFHQKTRITLAYLQNYPKLENCANLILAFRSKFKSELEKEKNP